MNNKTKFIILCCILMMTKRVQAMEIQRVNIQIPSFKVSINDIEMEKRENKYPIILYKDVTYFPMTYKNSRFLGVNTFWDKDTKILKIESDIPKGDYYRYIGRRNKNYDVAKQADFNIVVNGKDIDNKNEKFPLLVYRDVTYFPLTWRFCNDEFNWEYSFDKDSGLRISSKKNNYKRDILNVSSYNTNFREYYFSKEIGRINYLVGRNRKNSNIIISKVDSGKDVEVKDVNKNGSNLVLDNNNLYFTVDYETQKTVNCLNLIDMEEKEILRLDVNKWDPILMTALNGNIYYKTSIENGSLFNQNRKKLNREGSLTGLRKVNNYVFATFDKGDNLIVFDKNQSIVAKTKGNINVKTVSVLDGVLTFKDEDTGLIREVKFNI